MVRLGAAGGEPETGVGSGSAGGRVLAKKKLAISVSMVTSAEMTVVMTVRAVELIPWW